MGLSIFPTLQEFFRGSNNPFGSKVHKIIVLLRKLLISIVGISLQVSWHLSEGWGLETPLPMVEIFPFLILPGLGEVIPLLLLLK